MQTPTIGEYYSIEGYKPFLITGNKTKDIQSFREANNLSIRTATEIFEHYEELPANSEKFDDNEICG